MEESICGTINVYAAKNKLENESLVINDGEFISTITDSSEPGFALYTSYGDGVECFPITINGGVFNAYSGPGLWLNWKNFEINGGILKGDGDGILIVSQSENIIINNCKSIGKYNGIRIEANCLNINILGGYFCGDYNGLESSCENIYLSGGTFKSLGKNENNSINAAIYLNNYFYENFDVDKGIDQILKEGYEFSNNKYNCIVGEKYIDIASTELEVIVQKNKYNVFIKDSENGKISIFDNKFSKGDNVEVEILPEEGYILKNIEVIDIDGNLVEIDKENFTFKMPGNDVIINAEFEKKNNLKGDVNGDGDVTLADYALVLSHVKKTKLLKGDALKAADVNENGDVTLADYTLILSHVKKTQLLK